MHPDFFWCLFLWYFEFKKYLRFHLLYNASYCGQNYTLLLKFNSGLFLHKLPSVSWEIDVRRNSSFFKCYENKIGTTLNFRVRADILFVFKFLFYRFLSRRDCRKVIKWSSVKNICQFSCVHVSSQNPAKSWHSIHNLKIYQIINLKNPLD